MRLAARQSKAQCERGDSNPHTFRYQILSLARLPIPPLSLEIKTSNIIDDRPRLQLHRLIGMACWPIA
jgi:hypothetical protein